MSGRLEGRVSIVTGGGHGIGKAYARGLAKEGAKIVIAEIDAAAAKAVAEAMTKEGLAAAGGRALQRVETPEDLVGAILFFASADSDFVTGQTLVVDGGSCMR
jgi:3-oxoacyl-[acyl-carrier protein] reductase